MSEARVILPGSHRQPVENAEHLGPANQADQAHVTVYVRGKDEPLPVTTPGYYITSEEYAAAYGASANDFQAVIDFAKEYNLTPANENASTRSIELHGSVGDLSSAFGVSLDHVSVDGKVYRHRTGGISIPEKLLPIVRAVVGLDNRPQAKTHATRITPQTVEEALGAQSFTPLAIGQLYNFPPGLDGTGQTIAILELGGGFLQSDLVTYFQGLGIKMPSVVAVSVNGGKNVVVPNVPASNTELEVALDIQIAGALAPGAKQLVYFTPSASDQDFLAGLNAAITAKPQPVAISVSWVGPEQSYTGQLTTQFETALQHAAQLGIPVCMATGDNGSMADTKNHVLQVGFPASAPHSLACGGTTLIASGGKISSETVWSGSGGGVSQVFAKPSYQSSVTVPAPPTGTTGGRGIPDVAGDADPSTGYSIRCKGVNTVVGGTSAVAPLWAALIARFGQSLGKPVGFLQPLIYQSSVSSKAFQDVTQGNNDSLGKGGLYHAGPGWDPCTGFGSPNGVSLLAALKSGSPTHSSGSTGSPTPPPPSTGTPAPHDSPQFEFPVLPPPVPAPSPLAGLQSLGSSLGSALSGGSNSVALVGVVGLAAVMGMVAATGIVATVALAREKE